MTIAEDDGSSVAVAVAVVVGILVGSLVGEATRTWVGSGVGDSVAMILGTAPTAIAVDVTTDVLVFVGVGARTDIFAITCVGTTATTGGVEVDGAVSGWTQLITVNAITNPIAHQTR